jgi:Domain of unknown function (DUF4440)
MGIGSWRSATKPPFKRPPRSNFHASSGYFRICSVFLQQRVRADGRFSVFLAALALAVLARTQASDALKQEDQSFVRAFRQQKRTALDALMDANFIWIDSNGKRLSRPAVLQKLPTVANSDVEMQSRIYGHVAVVRANRGRVNVLRVQRKRPGGWRAV